jgi:hypothetical protein
MSNPRVRPNALLGSQTTRAIGAVQKSLAGIKTGPVSTGRWVAHAGRVTCLNLEARTLRFLYADDGFPNQVRAGISARPGRWRGSISPDNRMNNNRKYKIVSSIFWPVLFQAIAADACKSGNQPHFSRRHSRVSLCPLPWPRGPAKKGRDACRGAAARACPVNLSRLGRLSNNRSRHWRRDKNGQIAKPRSRNSQRWNAAQVCRPHSPLNQALGNARRLAAAIGTARETAGDRRCRSVAEHVRG